METPTGSREARAPKPGSGACWAAAGPDRFVQTWTLRQLRTGGRTRLGSGQVSRREPRSPLKPTPNACCPSSPPGSEATASFGPSPGVLAGRLPSLRNPRGCRPVPGGMEANGGMRVHGETHSRGPRRLLCPGGGACPCGEKSGSLRAGDGPRNAESGPCVCKTDRGQGEGAEGRPGAAGRPVRP